MELSKFPILSKGIQVRGAEPRSIYVFTHNCMYYSMYMYDLPSFTLKFEILEIF